MQDGATLLHAHVVATTQDLAVLRHQAGADGDAALGSTLPCLLHSCNETGVLLHGDCTAIDAIEWCGGVIYKGGNVERGKDDSTGLSTVRQFSS